MVSLTWLPCMLLDPSALCIESVSKMISELLKGFPDVESAFNKGFQPIEMTV